MSDFFDELRSIFNAFGPAQPQSGADSNSGKSKQGRQPNNMEVRTMELMHPIAREILEYRLQILELRDKYLPLKALTGPCDRDRAEKAVANVYSVLRLPPPKFVWFESPDDALSACIFWTIFRAMRAVAEPTAHNSSDFSGDAVLSQVFQLQPGELLPRFVAATLPTDARTFGNRAMAIQNAVPVGALRAGHEDPIYDHIVESMMNQRRGKSTPFNAWQETCQNMLEKLHDVDVNLASAFSHFEAIFKSLIPTHRELITNQALQHELQPQRTWRQRSRRTYVGTAERFAAGNGDTMFIFLVEVMRMFHEAPTTGFEEYRESVYHCGWWRPYNDLCIMVDRPTQLSLDDAGNLHRFDEPAVEYGDAFSLYAMRNVEVSPQLARGEFDAAAIENERNVELRRLMVERYGAARYLQEAGATQIDRDDEFGVLYEKRMIGSEPILMVKVTNSTPEPDGSFKDYYLRVPPNIRTAREAVAWTFGMERDEYKPKVQT